MLYLEFYPDVRLMPFIKRYVIFEKVSLDDAQRAVPVGRCQIAFHVSTATNFLNPLHNDEEIGSFKNPIVGPRKGIIKIASSGRIAIIKAEFTPIGFNVFFSTPASVLYEQVVSSEDFGDIELKELYERILEACSWQKRIELLNEFFLKRLAQRSTLPENIIRIECTIENMLSNIQTINIGKMAEFACLSERQFRRIFQETTGHTPSLFLHLQRLNEAKKLLFLEKTTLTELAYRCGYSDKPHLIKAFKTTTGMSPTDIYNYHNVNFNPDGILI